MGTGRGGSSLITSFQRTVARAFFGLPESDGFAVSGAAALIVQALTDRSTRDVDLFTVARPVPSVPVAAAAFEADARRRGWTVTRIQAEDSPPEHPPVTTELGPTLQPTDLAARKTLALFTRAEARDFVDVYRLAKIFGRDQLVTWAAQQDRGFDLVVFAAMLNTLHRFDDGELPLPDEEISNARAFFADWIQHIHTHQP
jgi:hypothetical protein